MSYRHITSAAPGGAPTSAVQPSTKRPGDDAHSTAEYLACGACLTTERRSYESRFVERTLLWRVVCGTPTLRCVMSGALASCGAPVWAMRSNTEYVLSAARSLWNAQPAERLAPEHDTSS